LHSAPVWRERADFIINAALPEPGRFEQLWTRRRADDRFKICCIPFFLYDVALGDIVETRPDGERKYLLSRVVEPSGRYVFRVRPDLPDVGTAVAGELEALGALLEWSSPSLLAVDAVDLAHAQPIADLLAQREARGELIYETGRTS
jgi:hypothetical protein